MKKSAILIGLCLLISSCNLPFTAPTDEFSLNTITPDPNLPTPTTQVADTPTPVPQLELSQLLLAQEDLGDLASYYGSPTPAASPLEAGEALESQSIQFTRTIDSGPLTISLYRFASASQAEAANQAAMTAFPATSGDQVYIPIDATLPLNAWIARYAEGSLALGFQTGEATALIQYQMFDPGDDDEIDFLSVLAQNQYKKLFEGGYITPGSGLATPAAEE